MKLKVCFLYLIRMFGCHQIHSYVQITRYNVCECVCSYVCVGSGVFMFLSVCIPERLRVGVCVCVFTQMLKLYQYITIE